MGGWRQEGGLRQLTLGGSRGAGVGGWGRRGGFLGVGRTEGAGYPGCSMGTGGSLSTLLLLAIASCSLGACTSARSCSARSKAVLHELRLVEDPAKSPLNWGADETDWWRDGMQVVVSGCFDGWGCSWPEGPFLLTRLASCGPSHKGYDRVLMVRLGPDRAWPLPESEVRVEGHLSLAVMHAPGGRMPLAFGILSHAKILR